MIMTSLLRISIGLILLTVISNFFEPRSDYIDKDKILQKDSCYFYQRQILIQLKETDSLLSIKK